MASGSHGSHGDHGDHGHHKGSGADRGIHDHDYHDPTEATNVKQPDDYKPGSDTWAYENPWPSLNKGRLDWLFADGWRRPLAKDQGQKMRRNWEPFGWNVYDEKEDWETHHFFAFFMGTVAIAWLSCLIIVGKPDWPLLKDWATREAYMELARREAAGLAAISKDYIEPSRIAACLPSDEELGDFEIVI